MAVRLVRPAIDPEIALGERFVHPDVGRTAFPKLVNIVAAAENARLAAKGLPGRKHTIHDLVDIERDLALDPVFSLRRHFRVYFLPATIAAGVINAAPQRTCIPFMLHVPSGSSSGKTITQFQNGVRQYFATADAVPATVFGEGVPGAARFLRPFVAKVGNTLSGQTTIANGTLLGMMCFDLAEEGMLAEPLGRPMQIGWNAGNLVVSGGNTIVRIKPQKDFRPRRIEFDSTVTNWVKQCDATHGLAVTGVLVANDPQTEANGSLPATMFDMFAQGGGWDFDGDECEVGAEVDINLTNNDATVGGITPVGTCWGDTTGQDE